MNPRHLGGVLLLLAAALLLANERGCIPSGGGGLFEPATLISVEAEVLYAQNMVPKLPDQLKDDAKTISDVMQSVATEYEGKDVEGDVLLNEYRTRLKAKFGDARYAEWVPFLDNFNNRFKELVAEGALPDAHNVRELLEAWSTGLAK